VGGAGGGGGGGGHRAQSTEYRAESRGRGPSSRGRGERYEVCRMPPGVLCAGTALPVALIDPGEPRARPDVPHVRKNERRKGPRRQRERPQKGAAKRCAEHPLLTKPY
jgi:hypothetical protein